MKELEGKIAAESEYKKQLKEGIVEARENLEVEKQKVLNDNKKKHDELVKVLFFTVERLTLGDRTKKNDGL